MVAVGGTCRNDVGAAAAGEEERGGCGGYVEGRERETYASIDAAWARWSAMETCARKRDHCWLAA